MVLTANSYAKTANKSAFDFLKLHLGGSIGV